MLLKLFEFLKLYWGYFMTVVATVTFIWTLGVKSERANNEKISIKEDIQEIKQSQKEEKIKTDSLLFIVNNIQEKQIELLESYNSLRNSYVKFLSSDDRLTKKYFIELMNGIEFQLSPTNTIVPISPVQPIDTNKIEYKISIKKIDKEENEY